MRCVHPDMTEPRVSRGPDSLLRTKPVLSKTHNRARADGRPRYDLDRTTINQDFRIEFR